MRRFSTLRAPFVVLVGGTFACTADVTGPNSPGVDAPVQAAMVAGAGQPADHIEDLGGAPAAVIHTASMLRTPRGVHIRLAVSAPAPNTATMWAVVFNSPSDCASSPCSADDLQNADAVPSIVRAAGRVLGTGGVTTLAGSVREGDPSEALFGPGLLDAMMGEVHAIFRLHHAPIPGLVDDQIHDVIGGCIVDEEDICVDAAAAIFLPPA